MKKFLVPVLLIVACLIPGCASHPIKVEAPPTPIRLELLKKSQEVPQNESEEVAKIYLEALNAEKALDLNKACNLFTDLSDKYEFPLRDAALVHTLKNCDLSDSSLEDLWKITSVAKYLKENYFELSKELAAKKNLPAYEAQFSFELIPFKKIQSEKVKLIKRAIAIAEELKDEEHLAVYQAKLKEISPLNNTEINNQNIYSIAKDFEASRQFDRARELYKQIITGEFQLNEKVKAFNAFRTSYKVERNLKIFLEKTYEMENFLKLELEKNSVSNEYKEAWAESAINLARAVWTDHKNAEARKILNDFLETKLGTNNQVATAHWLLGSLHLESKEQLLALGEFEIAGKIKVTDASLQENIQWALVWNSYLLKIYENVILYADKFTSKSTNIGFTSKLNYWKGKALVKLNKIDDAKVVFNDITITNPFDYYGIISHIETQTAISVLPKTQINTTPTGNNILDWLIAMDEKTYAQKYLKEVDTQFRTPAQRERAMSLYAQTEWYQGGMRQIYNFPAKSRNAITEKYINIIFPTPYLVSATQYGNLYNVPLELIYGITRQESAFVSTERSWADAFGLMQMIPEKAVELSKKYEIPYKDFNDLYIPDINLQMGTALLKDLREKFEGKFAQSVAAYNASEAVIKVWERERFNGDYFEFIEMIPYEETRNYIKLVFRNYVTYKRITSSQEFSLDPDFFAKPF
jgi:soluble lytic murein transglycosylase